MAVYKATLVTCGWGGVVFEVACYFGRRSEVKDRKTPQKVNFDGLQTDRPTELVLVVCMQLKNEALKKMRHMMEKMQAVRLKDNKTYCGIIIKADRALSLEPDLDYPKRDQWCSLLHS